MEQGSMRADVNVSVRRPGEDLGTRTETKNVNSIRFIGQAIDYEVNRQIDILEEGGEIDQETRLFDPKKGVTRSMRSKEEAHDYRYFPDPDLLPLEFDEALVEKLKNELPELPDEKKARFMADYGLSPYDAEVLIASRHSAAYFEKVAEGRDAKLAVNWVMGDLSAHANAKGVQLDEVGVSPDQLGQLIDLISDGTISGKIAKDVLEIAIKEGGDPAEIVEQRGLKQMSDTSELEAIVDDIIAANPKQVEQLKTKPKTLGWFVGQVMQKTKGKANPQAVNKLLHEKLEIGEG
jgi:aspartyl-tRNA(Asn)/glutamyl-tRNA(Gln) amidotransferase subunit B